MVDYSSAVNTIFGVFNSAWPTIASSVLNGDIPIIRWSDQESADPPVVTKYWVRVWQRNDSDQQRSIGRPALYTVHGFCYVQIFAPSNDPVAGANLRDLASMVKDAYTSQTVSGVRFRSVLIREFPSESKWHSKRVAAEYEFDYRK